MRWQKIKITLVAAIKFSEVSILDGCSNRLAGSGFALGVLAGFQGTKLSTQQMIEFNGFISEIGKTLGNQFSITVTAASFKLNN